MRWRDAGKSEAIRAGLLAAALLGAGLACGEAAAAEAVDCAEPKDGALPDIELRDVVSGLRKPVHLTNAGPGDARLYVVEQDGVIRLIEGGRIAPEPFLDIHARVASGGEKGLLSVAFHPKYRENGYFYVDYTTRRAGKLYTHVSRFHRASGAKGDPDSETVLLEIEQPFDNHNGGQLAFGPDGYLYVGMGDGGAANDPLENGQDLSNPLAALLRIDVDRKDPGRNYAVPADNPFVETRDARGEIWAYGLRNPWRFSFDRRTGLLYLADVGQSREEEIDVIRRGGNYGWPIMEGSLCHARDAAQCRRRDLIAPILAYGRSAGISVTGGFVARGAGAGALCGAYVYGDYGSGRIWGLRYRDGKVVRRRELLNTSISISSFGEGPEGEIYVLDHRSGSVQRIVAR
jgi:glucose/arabinose dehydrogenase